MITEALKLTTYFGERDRVAGGQFLADALTDIFARHALRSSLVVRGVEGFGLRQHLRTDRLLTLSEDLPIVSVAVDARPRIEALLPEVTALPFDGLVTLERARILTDATETPPGLPWEPDAETKLTIYLGRHQRLGGGPAHQSLVEHLHARGIAGATVLLGVDGTAHGLRHRARFFGRNADVPVMVIAVGATPRIASVLPELTARLPQALVTLERVRVCKRDGHTLGAPERLPKSDAEGLALWQKLMVYAGEQATAAGEPLHHALVHRLRTAGAAGATSLRGIWGYHGDHAPHGDSFWQLRRRVPVVTVIVDTPERVQQWYEIVDALTVETGLVTTEVVPAYRATAAGQAAGGLSLAAPTTSGPASRP